MLRALALFLPVIFPSWRFFAWIAPSPRIEIAPETPNADGALDWRPFRPRPARVSPLAMAGRLFWNSGWNETLFLVSRAEVFLETGSERALADVIAGATRAEDLPGDRFLLRLVVVRREGDALVRQEAYRSEPLGTSRRQTSPTAGRA